jgi:hypothetical protein
LRPRPRRSDGRNAHLKLVPAEDADGPRCVRC